MPTFEQYATDYLHNHGVFADQAAAIVAAAKADPANADVRDRWSEDVAGYPSPIRQLLRTAVANAAAKWLKEHDPKHWALPVFAAMTKARADGHEVVVDRNLAVPALYGRSASSFRAFKRRGPGAGGLTFAVPKPVWASIETGEPMKFNEILKLPGVVPEAPGKTTLGAFAAARSRPADALTDVPPIPGEPDATRMTPEQRASYEQLRATVLAAGQRIKGHHFLHDEVMLVIEAADDGGDDAAGDRLATAERPPSHDADFGA